MPCLIWVLRGSMSMLRTCKNMHGGTGLSKCVGMLGWFKWLGMLGWLELGCPTVSACLFKVRPGVLSKTLSHMWGNLHLPIFLFKVGLLTLNKYRFFNISS